MSPRHRDAKIDGENPGCVEDGFEDSEHGGYFTTAREAEVLLAREKPAYDGAEPSGNSIQALNLLRLHQLTGDATYQRRAERLIGAFAGTLTRSPQALSAMLNVVDFLFGTPKEIAIIVPSQRAEADPFLAKLRLGFTPNCVLAVASSAEVAVHAQQVAVLQNRVAQRGKATAYVCQNQVCQLPTTDPDAFAVKLQTPISK